MIYGYDGDFDDYKDQGRQLHGQRLVRSRPCTEPAQLRSEIFYQNIWTTPEICRKAKSRYTTRISSATFSAYVMEWETLKDGKVMRSGTVERIDCQPQQTATMTLDWGGTTGRRMVAQREIPATGKRRHYSGASRGGQGTNRTPALSGTGHGFEERKREVTFRMSSRKSTTVIWPI